MKIITTAQYKKKFHKFIKKHPELVSRYKKTILLLESNINHPSLRLHALQGEHEGIHSVSINLSYRIILVLKITEDQIIPINIGNHDEVY